MFLCYFQLFNFENNMVNLLYIILYVKIKATISCSTYVA